MPWLGEQQPPSQPTQPLRTVIQSALRQRIDADRLEGPLKELQSQHPVSPDEYAKTLLDFRAKVVGADDPLLYHYVSLVLRAQLTRTSSILKALLAASRITGDASIEMRSIGMPSFEERVFSLLVQLHMTNEAPSAPIEAHARVHALARWMHAVTSHETAKQVAAGALHAADYISFGMYESLGSLVITLFGVAGFRDVAKQSWWKSRRATVVAEMQDFDTHVLQWLHSSLGGRLHALATLPPFLETDVKGNPILNDQQILQSISEVPVMASRAGLFIWLNAALSARPLTDDMSMLAYLQARFAGENQALINDLLIACFDVLTNALLRKDSEEDLRIIRSFVCNKVPSVLTMLSGFMAPPMTVETCIQMAFLTISMDALPPLSKAASESRDKLKLTRTEFLQACYLHGLVTEATVTSIVPESPVTMPKTKYNKDSLLAQCNNNLSRLETLIGEIETAIGNAGAIANCLVETINHFCVGKDTMSLKSLCNILTRKAFCLDIVLQYTQPANFLFPICTVLSEWIHDQDQTELTPSYEEFSSILLFLCVVVHRYGLQRADLGLANDGNFVTKLLQEKSISHPLSELTEEQNAQLGKWIEGLYGTDEQGESSGISEEVMRQCPPQSFFLLVPTLFEQSILACKSGALPIKTFKGGLELLVEPFLVPALIGGLDWLIKHSWEDHGDADTILQILEKLLKPSSSSSDTKAMHQAVFAIVAKPMHESLQELLKKKPAKEKLVKSLMEVVRPHLHSQRTIDCSLAELAAWTETPDGGIRKRLQESIDDQVAWVSEIGPTPPPRYTHRLFACACNLLGPAVTLSALTAAIIEHTSKGKGPLALDICSAMVAAPLPDLFVPSPGMVPSQQAHPNASLSVRDALRLHVANPQTLLRLPEAEAEALVRLSRRVEAQLTISQIPQLAMPLPLQDQTASQMMADIEMAEQVAGAASAAGTALDAAAVSAADFANADLSVALGQSIDLSGVSDTQGQTAEGATADLSSAAGQSLFDGLGLLGGVDQSMAGVDGTAGGAQPGMDDEDIFAGLDIMGVDDDFNFA